MLAAFKLMVLIANPQNPEDPKATVVALIVKRRLAHTGNILSSLKRRLLLIF